MSPPRRGVRGDPDRDLDELRVKPLRIYYPDPALALIASCINIEPFYGSTVPGAIGVHPDMIGLGKTFVAPRRTLLQLYTSASCCRYKASRVLARSTDGNQLTQHPTGERAVRGRSGVAFHIAPVLAYLQVGFEGDGEANRTLHVAFDQFGQDAQFGARHFKDQFVVNLEQEFTL